MAWIGKIIGGTVGLVIGGPLGMIAGAAFGHMIDRSSDMPQDQQGRTFEYYRRSGGDTFGYDPQYQAQLVFFVGIFSMLAKLALADGAVSDQERRKVMEFIDHDLRLTGESREAALRIFETALREGGSFEEFALQYYQQFSRDRNMLEMAVDILFRVAMADGNMTRAEEQLLYTAVRTFRLPQAVIDALRNRYGSSERTARGRKAGKKHSYGVLGVSPSASNEEIKRAYRKLVSEYHPDKIAAKGLPDEFISFAHDKFREIQEAYESIRKERGL